MNLNILFGVMATLFLISCGQEKYDILFSPNENITIKALKKQGFERKLGEGAIIFEKIKEDTAIIYQFESLYGEPLAVGWQILVDSFNSEGVNNILDKYECTLVSNYSCGSSFFIHNVKHNILMQGQKITSDKNKKFIISYNFLKK